MKELFDQHWPLMVAAVLIALAIALPRGAHAADLVFVGNCNTVSWGAPVDGGPIDGYRVYVNDSVPIETAALSISCSDLPTVVGNNSVYVAAYNASGEAATMPVPFDILILPPGAPTDLTIVGPVPVPGQ